MSTAPTSPAENEAFNTAVEQMIEAVNQKQKGSERRRGKRFPYPVVQFVAMYDNKGLPAKDQFHQVQCVDISTGGISFLWPELPDFQYIVLQLETPTSDIDVTARITFSKPVDDPPGHYHVGCQFTGRVRSY